MDFKAETIADSPLERPRPEQGIDFDFNTDRNSIGRNKIKNITFDQASGGTITLGGTANGNGVMLVKDSSGDTIVTVDNTGILVDGGNIIVKNADNTTIIDTSGIVSAANFPNESAFNGSAGLNTTSTSFTDVTGSSLGTIITTRTIRVFVYIMGYGRNSHVIETDGTAQMEIELFDNGISDGVMNIFIGGLTTTRAYVDGGGTLNIDQYSNDIMSARSAVVDVAAGTHSYKLRYRATSSGTAHLDAWSAGYIQLGV